MKFIKYAVGLVIALSVIPMVVVAVTKLDEPRLKTVEFEVVDVGVDNFTFSENAYNDIQALAIFDDFKVSNLITVTVNNVDLDEIIMNVIIGEGSFNIYKFNSNEQSFSWEELDDSNLAWTVDYNPTIGDKWTMIFEVPLTMPPLVKLLVGFAPLLFVGGILLFMLNKRKLD